MPNLRSFLARTWARALAPRMRYGLHSADGVWRAHSRIGSHTQLEAPEKLAIGDHVYIGHFNFIDASGGLAIGTGCQITNHCSVLTHSSHRALRLERERYWGHAAPAGLQSAPVAIGEWSFVGPHCVIAPGTRIGRGVVVRAYSFVRGEVPDFAVVEGQPARVVGDVRERDRAWLERANGIDAATRAAYDDWVAAAPR
ncbi:MAG TPA: acyltransferase [Methylibium sp.]|uniref:acyltransferase n=1 Tax=Methylibium sp. TaxID=2067992 RepID=UPI002DBD8B1B|nr:acyltransferase [Methylibium sp.]HEU4460742.1 acyltransferase [Methylibium sp.]